MELGPEDFSSFFIFCSFAIFLCFSLPFFVVLLFLFVFLCFFCLFLIVFLRFLLGQAETTAIYWENGEFQSDPVCTDPVENFPISALSPPSVRGVFEIDSFSLLEFFWVTRTLILQRPRSPTLLGNERNTMGAGIIAQLNPQQLLLCNWCACDWILIPRALLLCVIAFWYNRGKITRQQRYTRITQISAFTTKVVYLMCAQLQN